MPTLRAVGGPPLCIAWKADGPQEPNVVRFKVLSKLEGLSRAYRCVHMPLGRLVDGCAPRLSPYLGRAHRPIKGLKG